MFANFEPWSQLVRIVSPNTSARPRDRGKRDTVVRFSANNATVLPSVCRQDKFPDNVQTKSDKVSNGANRLPGNTGTGRKDFYSIHFPSLTMLIEHVTIFSDFNWSCLESFVILNYLLVAVGVKWLVSANEKASLLSIDQSEAGRFMCDNDSLGMGLISCSLSTVIRQ